MPRLSEVAIRIKKLRGVRSQAEFASEVGLPQSRLSEYQRGVNPPAKALIRFAHFAFKQGLYGDAIWFLEKAGIDTDLLLEIGLIPDKNAAVDAALVPVLPHPRIHPEGKRAGSASHARPFPAWMIPKRGVTFYVEATDDFVVPFNRGDLILVDSSEVNQAELLGSYVVAFRPNHFSNAERLKLQTGFVGSMSPEEIKRRRDRSQFPFLRTGLFIGRLVPDQNQTFGANVGLRAMEIRTKSGDTLFEVLRPDAHEMVIAETDADREAIYQMARKAASSSLGRKNIGKNISVLRLYTDLQILGRAIGWVAAPPRELPRKEPEK
jgi:hypothetical protein